MFSAALLATLTLGVPLNGVPDKTALTAAGSKTHHPFAIKLLRLRTRSG